MSNSEKTQLPSKEWRCFHCDEVFTDEAAAREHFGPSELCSPGCHIGIAEYRRMEELHRAHMAEDSDMHRRLYALRAEHQTALRREEEKGYARGLQDARNEANAHETTDWRAIRERELRYLEGVLLNIRKQDGEGARESADDTLAWLRNRLAVKASEPLPKHPCIHCGKEFATREVRGHHEETCNGTRLQKNGSDGL